MTTQDKWENNVKPLNYEHFLQSLQSWPQGHWRELCGNKQKVTRGSGVATNKILNQNLTSVQIIIISIQ